MLPGKQRKLLELIDYITPNETELRKLSESKIKDSDSLSQMAEYFVKKGVKNVIVTLGEKGALLVNEQKQLLLEAEKVNGIDTTAAGDCFNGALAVALAEGKPLEESISFANKAAAIAVTRRGAIESLPYRDEMASEERISGVTSKQIKA